MPVTLSRRGKAYPKPCKAHRGPVPAKKPSVRDTPPLLTALEQAVLNEHRPLMRQALEDRVREEEQRFAQLVRRCGQCKAVLLSKGIKRTKCLTQFGQVEIPSHVLRCADCHTSERPFLAYLGLEAAGRLSPMLARLVALMATVVPYEMAATLLLEFLGVRVSPMTVWRTVQRLGEGADQHSQNMAVYDRHPGRVEEAPQNVQEVVIAGTDGCALGMQVRSGRRKRQGTEVLPPLPTLEDGHFREVKSGVLLLPKERVETSPGRHSVVRRALVTCLGNADQVFDLMWSKLLQLQWLGPNTMVVVIGDGAEWIWNRAKMFPNHCEILDFWHAVEKGWEWARTRFGPDSKEAKELMKGITEKLRAGKVQDVLAQLLTFKPLTPEEAQKLTTLIRYYTDNACRMRYDQYRAMNYGIGSGAIESAHKQLVHARMRQAGMRWSEDGARRLLALRVTLLNGDWDKLHVLPMKRLAA